jgi:hypothetical protein
MVLLVIYYIKRVYLLVFDINVDKEYYVIIFINIKNKLMFIDSNIMIFIDIFIIRFPFHF